MQTIVITLATTKGGAGKSTLVRNLGSYWYNLGMKVMIIDADPQGSIINRHDIEGPLKNLIVIAQPEETVIDVLKENRGKYNYILVDTGGFKNRTTIKALIETDLTIIPLKPSADDAAGAIDTFNLIQELNAVPERINNPIKYRMILTMSQQNTIIAKQIRMELQQEKYMLLQSEMYQRVAYPEAAIKGLSPCITESDGAAARDISSIVQEINKILQR